MKFKNVVNPNTQFHVQTNWTASQTISGVSHPVSKGSTSNRPTPGCTRCWLFVNINHYGEAAHSVPVQVEILHRPLFPTILSFYIVYNSVCRPAHIYLSSSLPASLSASLLHFLYFFLSFSFLLPLSRMLYSFRP